MKTRFLMMGALIVLMVTACSKDDKNSSSDGSSDFISSTNVDVISDDVSQIVELESDETTPSNRLASSADNFLSDCAQVTTQVSGNTVTRTINFGETNCTLNNGNTVRGKIILTFTNDWTAATRTINYSFENFYHNDNHVEGNRSVVKTILDNGHPQANISLNMTVTTPNNSVYTVEGNRIREFVEGYGNGILADNVFQIQGSWSTTLPNGNVHSHTINEATPLRIIYSCNQVLGRHRFEIVSGILTIVKNTRTAVIDYGDGQCDNQGTISINGGTPITFILRN